MLAAHALALQAANAVLEAHRIVGGGAVKRWDGKVVEAEVDA